jgi:hypothetical protein
LKKLVTTLTLAAALAAAAPASAYFLTCNEYRLAVISGDERLGAIAFGQAFGVSDMLATLLCFAGDRRCGCLQNLTDRAGDYGGAVGRLIARCPANSPAVGQIFNAALEVCR